MSVSQADDEPGRPRTSPDPEDGARGPGEPGASRHGNFINYYRFHPARERARRLPLALCAGAARGRKYVALDVGCNAGIFPDVDQVLYRQSRTIASGSQVLVTSNSGHFEPELGILFLFPPYVLRRTITRTITSGPQDLTLELHKFLSHHLPDREISILGIDLDPILIERAREKNDRPRSVSFECLDFFSGERESVISSYLSGHEAERFDASFCFSITMWIHLNHGDSGLERFLGDVCALSEAVLVEPQPWRCYRTAARRLRRADLGEFHHLDGLKYRGDTQLHIERILEEQCRFRKVLVTEENDWQRRLLLYVRADYARASPDC